MTAPSDTPTPETDAKVVKRPNSMNWTSPFPVEVTYIEADYVDADFARILEAKAERVTRERDQWRNALCSVTAGGSEYATDPDACVEYVRTVRGSQHRVIATYKARAETAEREAAQARRERDLLADALFGCFTESTGEYGTGYMCSCCETPIKIREWMTAEHKPDCPVLVAKRIYDENEAIRALTPTTEEKK